MLNSVDVEVRVAEVYIPKCYALLFHTGGGGGGGVYMFKGPQSVASFSLQTMNVEGVLVYTIIT
jgi:hypothetical protein